jgi:hypothetical protein
VVLAAWEHFIHEEELHNIMETLKKLPFVDTLFLSKLFGGENKAPESQLNLMLLELIRTLGKNSFINFEYKNGNKGSTIIIPHVKNEQ